MTAEEVTRDAFVFGASLGLGLGAVVVLFLSQPALVLISACATCLVTPIILDHATDR